MFLKSTQTSKIQRCQCILKNINLLTEHSSLLQRSRFFILKFLQTFEKLTIHYFPTLKKKKTPFQTPFFSRLSNWKSIERQSNVNFRILYFGLRDGEQSFEAWNRWRLLLLFPLEKEEKDTAPSVECLAQEKSFAENRKALCRSRFGTHKYESH